MKVILFDQKGHPTEAWTSLKDLCKQKDLPFHTITRLKFPFIFRDLSFRKLDVKQYKF